MDHQMNGGMAMGQQGMAQGQGAYGMGGNGQAGGFAQTMNGQGMYGQGMNGQGMAQPGMGYAMYAPYYAQQNTSMFNDRFLKGLLIGAAAAYLLTNESVQRNAIKGAVKAWSLLQGGVEELKERFHDAEAEVRAEASE